MIRVNPKRKNYNPNGRVNKGGSLSEQVALLKTFHRDLYPQIREILGNLPVQTEVVGLRVQPPTPKIVKIKEPCKGPYETFDVFNGYNNGILNLDIVYDYRVDEDPNYGTLATEYLIMANYSEDKIPKGFSLIRELIHDSPYGFTKKPKAPTLWQTSVTYIMVKTSPDDSIFLR